MRYNRIMKRALSILLTLCCCAGLLSAEFPFSRTARAEQVDTTPSGGESADTTGWLYRIADDGYAEVLGYSDPSATNLAIPTSLGGAWVVRIAADAFADNAALATITIPATVADISATAFPGHAALTIRAANGTAALRFADQRGFDAVNTSQYDFFDDILDLSEMKKSQFSLTGNAVTLASPYSVQATVGGKLFLPAAGEYADGLPLEITSVTKSGASVVLTFTALDFTETLETYSVEDVPLTPDLDNVIILEEGFQLLNTESRGEASLSVSQALSFKVDHELVKGVKVQGSLSYAQSTNSRSNTAGSRFRSSPTLTPIRPSWTLVFREQWKSTKTNQIHAASPLPASP